MDDLIKVDGIVRRFGTIFLELEGEATRLGWHSFAAFARQRISESQLLELAFWYSLYGLVDHLYHRQSIEGPFPAEPSRWLRTFGEKIDSVLLPFVSLGDREDQCSAAWHCAAVGSDGQFHWLVAERGNALARLRHLFLTGAIDPFGINPKCALTQPS